jgi:Secretion system C-terminal sorting domain
MFSAILSAQWSTNPAVNNAICTAISGQSIPTIVSDGSGGAIITWEDYRSGTNADIYAQKINASGVVQWTADGVAISTNTTSQYIPTIASDGSGGAIITWRDMRNGNSDIYAQRINSSGVVVWTTDGVPVSVASNIQTAQAIVSDGLGGAIITWHDYRSGTDYDIYAQRINNSGAVQWAVNGVIISNASNGQEFPAIVSDGSAGAIITWNDYRSGSPGIYAQRINSSGVVQWTANGFPISTGTGGKYPPTIASDGSGGAIITWQDYRNAGTTNNDIYAQRINASAVVQWTSDGVAISIASNEQLSPTIVGDGSGGAIITWQDFRGTNADIYAQYVDGYGILPVELSSFTAVNKGKGIELKWKTATEINNYGFEIEKSRIQNIEVSRQNKTVMWDKIGFVEGTGTANTPKEYLFTDENLSAGKYSYRLKQIDHDGKFEYSQQVEVTVSAAPKEFALDQNYPNPFNPTTTIQYSLPSSATVKLAVYDLLGREIATLVNEEQSAGWKEVEWNGAAVSSGIYFYKLTAGNYVGVKKLMLLK